MATQSYIFQTSPKLSTSLSASVAASGVIPALDPECDVASSCQHARKRAQSRHRQPKGHHRRKHVERQIARDANGGRVSIGRSDGYAAAKFCVWFELAVGSRLQTACAHFVHGGPHALDL